MVCRLCFSEKSDDYIDIFSEDKISRYIKQFLELEINENDPVSKLICTVCWQQLKDFQNFYTQIKEAQRRPLVKMKKELSVGEKELVEVDDSAFEYVSTEIDDQELNESSEITMHNEGELQEQIVPDNYSDMKSTTDPPPNHLKKKSRHSKTLSKTTRSFKNESERKFFVELMKREEVIWNRTHTLHSSSRALTEAWKRISLSMPTQKTVHECKVMWKSLRDALRYERRKAASGVDQGHDLRNLLYFVSATNGQRKGKNLTVSSTKKPESTDETPSKNTGKCRFDGRKKYKIQNYHLFDTSAAPWSDRTCENSVSDVSAYSEGPSKHFSNNVTFEAAAADRPHSTSGIFTISTAPSNNMEVMNEPPPEEYKSSANNFYGDVKSEFKDEVSDLVGSISKALNRLVTIATTQTQMKPNTIEFKYEYIWKLIECLYAQMDQTTINDLNQRIINMVYEGCKINVY
ncbi:uncharacterized protein LOC129952213 [Eupeodes corollae]|uniref:uncharacterized protein LOC129952213 n=1 Tax=Eupeodes corollae TaxID=290404 RepID=UPI0024927811|nr:uncharacterized protein LOC129952213 [Eupeodes corollae]